MTPVPAEVENYLKIVAETEDKKTYITHLYHNDFDFHYIFRACNRKIKIKFIFFHIQIC